jgi:4-diphosphocytidyl-2-C-methyl-D-erythritol kinase
VPSVRVRVPAKVNLHLSVGPLRDDGFHELVTVFQALDLTDEVTASPGTGLSLRLSGEGAHELPTHENNLAWRAALLLAKRAGIDADVHLAVDKRIPVAGGMAGGSADAAGALLACARLWGVEADLAQIAAELGSDAAFPLIGGTALGTGRGERLTPVPTKITLHWAVAVAGFGISTPEAYAELDRHRAARAAPPPVGPPEPLLAALASGDAAGIAAAMANDLQPAAIAQRPELRRTLDLGREAGALRGIVSGSGPTCAFLCADADTAEHVAALLLSEGVCRDAVTASSPAPGAQVID